MKLYKTSPGIKNRNIKLYFTDGKTNVRISLYPCGANKSMFVYLPEGDIPHPGWNLHFWLGADGEEGLEIR